MIFAFDGMADGLDDGAHNNVQLLNAGKVTTTDTPTTAAPTTAEPTQSSTLWQLSSERLTAAGRRRHGGRVWEDTIYLIAIGMFYV